MTNLRNTIHRLLQTGIYSNLQDQFQASKFKKKIYIFYNRKIFDNQIPDFEDNVRPTYLMATIEFQL